MFRLKKKYEAFMVVDGPYAGNTYRHGVVFEKVPPNEQHKFEEIQGKQPEKAAMWKPETAAPQEPATPEDEGGD
jgi:hypothetical protein